MLIDWDPKFSVSVTRFDDDHRQLLSTINELHSAMLDGKGSSALGLIFERLNWYITAHFNREEILMQRYNYPGFGAHKAEHDQFTARVFALSGDYKSGSTAISSEVVELLQRWLAEHILRSDTEYVPFLRSVGFITHLRADAIRP